MHKSRNRIRRPLRFVPPSSGFGRSDREYNRVFNIAGVDARPPKNSRANDLHKASIFLFKYILHPLDARWRLAYQYARLKGENQFKKFNLHNALIAKYGSRMHSSQIRFSEIYTDLKHTLHLARALANIEIGNRIQSNVKNIENIFGYDIKMGKTTSISRGTDSEGVTGCPEALWQLQLRHNGKYIGRIGFNFHREGKDIVATITNIQGRKEVKSEMDHFQELTRERFNDYLVQTLRRIIGPKIQLRGIKNPNQNPTLYAMTFRKNKVHIFEQPPGQE